MPDPWTITLAIALALAALALVMTLLNLPIYRATPKPNTNTPPQNPPHLGGMGVPPVSSSASTSSGSESIPNPPTTPTVFVCIPARNEQANIESCVRRVLASTYPSLRVLVYDDQSTDETPAILARLIAEDPRLSTIPTAPLPDGWVGKMHACHQLGTHAARRAESDEDRILFIDADVSLEPDAIEQAMRTALAHHTDLLSTFPRQVLGTTPERLVVPMIHFILFSYLPMPMMRRSNSPGLSAACGQFLLISAPAYRAIEGHTSFKDSMHDGIKMPRAVRAAGRTTDLFDATETVSCRMYDSWSSTWRGFAKNAYEGLGSPILLLLFTAMHITGHILPWAFLIAAPFLTEPPSPIQLALAAAAIALNITQRLILSRAFKHPLWIALAHPISIALMTIIQWHSFILSLTNRRTWRGRTFAPTT
ncbi:MAG: glycosyltransferase [Phycisphaerales bacterium]